MRQNRVKMRFFLVLLAVCFFKLGSAQNTYRFRNYTISDGLSQSAVTTVVQDLTGTLWIGTQDGLNRFDGKTFENYTSDNTTGLENEYIHAAIVGRNDKLWFGTANGLTSYDVYKEQFHTYQIQGNSALQIESLVEDFQGNIWFGSASGGIYVWNKKTLKIQSVDFNLETTKIGYIAFLSSVDLLISTEDKGLFLVNIQSKKVKKINLPSAVRVNTAAQFRNEKWILGTTKGLFQLDSESLQTEIYAPEIQKTVGEFDITAVLIENKSTLFLATRSNGLLTVSTDNNQFSAYQHTTDLFQNTSLLHNELSCLFKDKSGTFWVGTDRGLGSFDPLNAGFIGVGTRMDLKRGLPSASVWCFGEDPQQKVVFVGTDNALSRVDRKTGLFDQFFTQQKDEEKTDYSILSVFVISENDVLVGTTNGLYRLKINSTSNYTFSKLPFKKLENASNFERIYSIVHWKADYYFLATKGGAVLYQLSTGETQVFEHNSAKKNSTIGGGVCRLVYKDLSGNVWFSTSVGGLYQLTEKNGVLSIVPSPLNDVISQKSKDYITSMLQTSPTEYWLGTMGSGVIQLNIQKKTAELFNKKKGLANNVVYGVLPDRSGNLWMSSNKGISKMNLRSKKFTNYTEVDGLMGNEFNQGAFLRSKSGELYFGGINGYNYFNPSELSEIQKPVEVVFTKLKLDKDWLIPGDESKILQSSVFDTKRLSFSYKQRSFTLKFMALNMSNPDLIAYKYVLEGSEEGEIFIGNSNQIHFNALQPGEYVLRVYARLGNGVWSETPGSIEIYVAAPFWKTAWFWLVFALIVGITVFVLIRKKIEFERREQVRLEMKIAERTREIREQNIQIEKQRRTIEEKKNNLEEQKRLLEVEKEKTEKLLKNIIPESTYQELKTKGKASARAYKTVSVMFTDFVGFTKIAERMKPSDLVNELDIYFRKFDEIIVRNNLEKIKTIGDAYMCAGGVPVRNNTNPIDACLAALQIQESMRLMRQEAIEQGREVFDLRLGINTGEVTAGVIGSEKLAYDIWGSTVNQAQRMEMLGEPGKVTISGQTYKFIEPYFKCTFRGKARSKSKGYIDMYTVDSIKPELSVDGLGIYPNEKFRLIVNLHFYSSINYYKAERHIMKMLEKNLSPKLHYHSIAHTKDVCLAIERLAIAEGITDEGLFLLKSAATYHDAGFVESYEKNEPVGARLAEEILPNYGYSEQHIEQIKKLIYVTQIPHKPTDHLEEIICDADLDYLGRSDFHEIADKLRLELREHGKIDSDRKWDEIQVQFLTSHQYFTETAKRTRDAKKAQNLQEIKDRLKRGEYVD